MTSFERVATADEAREASPQVVTVGGRTVGLFYHEGSFHAVDPSSHYRRRWRRHSGTCSPGHAPAG